MLYAIGDLHLSFQSDKPMDIFGAAWENHEQRLKAGFERLTDEDTCVICGDITWGMNLEEAKKDFEFIDSFPGRKIILKGNHDYWWSTATKAKKFFQENDIKTIDILYNNCFFVDEDTAICGTRGWFYEENRHGEHDKKIMNRELSRLETSLKAAGDAKNKLCFFHYPPIFGSYICREMTEMMVRHKVAGCWYGHIHGKGHKLAFTGTADGIKYHMVSADYIGFVPEKVL